MTGSEKANKSYEEWLASEQQFADAAYLANGTDLAIAPHMLKRYANPVEKWDFRQAMMRGMGDIRGKELLDFGCGMGEESMYLASLGALVTAIDISRVGVGVAAKRAEFNNLPLKTQVTDCLKSGLPSGSFDVIHCLGVLHHIGLEKGLIEAHRLLRRGGRMVLAEHISTSPLVEALRRRFGSDKTTEDEGPVPLSDLLSMPAKVGFRVDDYSQYAIFYRLRSMVPTFGSVFFQKVDHALLTVLPPLKRLSGCAVLSLTKQ